jgi:hypothetical protein
MKINYDNRAFKSVSNSETGEVSQDTTFYYHQKDDLVWAEYAGGGIVFGSLIAKVLPDDSLEMRYRHLNKHGELMTGKCVSKPEILDDGRLRTRGLKGLTEFFFSRRMLLTAKMRRKRGKSDRRQARRISEP